MTLLWLGILNLSVGLIALALALPLTKGRVAMNNTYGVRFTQAMASDENWYAINQFGGRCFIWWSLPIIVIGIGLIAFSLPMNFPPVRMGIVALFCLSTLLVLGAYIQASFWTAKHYPPRNV